MEIPDARRLKQIEEEDRARLAGCAGLAGSGSSQALPMAPARARSVARTRKYGSVSTLGTLAPPGFDDRLIAVSAASVFSSISAWILPSFRLDFPGFFSGNVRAITDSYYTAYRTEAYSCSKSGGYRQRNSWEHQILLGMGVDILLCRHKKWRNAVRNSIATRPTLELRRPYPEAHRRSHWTQQGKR